MNRNCYYFVEGSCEKTFIDALKENPSQLIAGKVTVLNVVQNKIKSSILIGLKERSRIVFVFDTDIDNNISILKDNIKSVKKYCHKVEIITIPQVNNFEDELLRSTNAKNIIEITKSKSKSDFKRDFCKLDNNCRKALERHNFNIDKLWINKPNNNFSFVDQQSHIIKIKKK